ncbi:hypothetical protein WJX84_001844 [Apatococcus fuscideae]|uniref:Uncharacterized protein n=1 Tax=Apatococcus fuscideae TaxID=2026836 RepID=A0AAW1TC62_9CHLO
MQLEAPDDSLRLLLANAWGAVLVNHVHTTDLRFVSSEGPASVAELHIPLGQGRQVVSVCKPASPFYGSLTVHNISGPPNAWLPQPPQPPSRRVEVIGASVSNGFGNRGHHEGRLGAPASHAMPPREASDPSQAFGPILGRLLQAECRVIAYE